MKSRNPGPAWLDRGVVLITNHEPLLHTRQMGSISADGERQYHAWRGLETVRAAKALGCNLIILPGHKGGGFAAERADIEASRRMARLCHKHGIRVGAYIGDTLFTTIFFQEHPEARDWVTRNAAGRPTYCGDQVFRQVACRQNPGYLGFLKECVRLCIEEIGVDLLHFDNWVSRLEPHRCRCRHCAEAFRAFVRARYADAELHERYGFTDLSDLGAPPMHEQPDLEDWKRDVISEPWQQDWIRFHCQALADAYGTLAHYARGLKPDIAMECNPGGLDDRNTALLRAVDHPQLLQHGHCLWSEENGRPGLSPEGDLVNRIRSMKMARTLDQQLFVYATPEGAAPTALAEAIAFNQPSVGCIWLDAAQADGSLVRLLNFRRRHASFFIGTTPLADASVLRNFETLAYHNWGPRIAVRLAEQSLIQGHVPFDIIFDQQLSERQPKVLVLPDVRCLSEDQARRITACVRAGMGLVATEQTGCFTPGLRRRERSVLADLIGFESDAEAAWGPARRRTLGKGRVAWLPGLPPARPIPQPADYYATPVFQLPSNASELIEAVRWAGRPSVELFAPASVAAEFKTQPGRVLVHLVNYSLGNAVSGLEIRLHAPLAGAKRRAWLLSPEGRAEKLECVRRGAGLSVSALHVERYALAVIE